MSDDKSVLGNLPHSRPGTRSNKRSGRPADATEAAAKASEQTPPPAAAKAPKPARPRTAAAKPKPDPAAPAASAESGDPLAEAARVAAKAVGAGVKLGTGLAQEVLRRLPGR
jgi:hypothetical protein